mgnify:CR=1 FL=1
MDRPSPGGAANRPWPMRLATMGRRRWPSWQAVRVGGRREAPGDHSCRARRGYILQVKDAHTGHWALCVDAAWAYDGTSLGGTRSSLCGFLFYPFEVGEQMPPPAHRRPQQRTEVYLPGPSFSVGPSRSWPTSPTQPCALRRMLRNRPTSFCTGERCVQSV